MIRLEPIPLDPKRGFTTTRGFRARRNGLLLRVPSGAGVRMWATEERARKALAKAFPGEPVEVVQ